MRLQRDTGVYDPAEAAVRDAASDVQTLSVAYLERTLCRPQNASASARLRTDRGLKTGEGNRRLAPYERGGAGRK